MHTTKIIISESNTKLIAAYGGNIRHNGDGTEYLYRTGFIIPVVEVPMTSFKTKPDFTNFIGAFGQAGIATCCTVGRKRSRWDATVLQNAGYEVLTPSGYDISRLMDDLGNSATYTTSGLLVPIFRIPQLVKTLIVNNDLDSPFGELIGAFFGYMGQAKGNQSTCPLTVIHVNGNEKDKIDLG